MNAVAYKPDGKYFLSASVSKLKVWNVETGENAVEVDSEQGTVRDVDWSSGGEWIVSGGFDGTVKVWDKEGKGTTLVGHKDAVHSVAFSSDGTKIVSGSHDQKVVVWSKNPQGWQPLGKEIATLRGAVYSVAFSPDGKQIVCGGADAMVRIVDVATARVKQLEGHTREIRSVAWSPDGKRIVSGSWDKTVRVWDPETGQEMLTLKAHAREVDCVAFSPDSMRIASGSKDQTLRIWNIAPQAVTGNLTINGHTDGVRSVRFNQDGKRIVSGSSDKLVTVWNAETGEGIQILKGHSGHVMCAAFSPDGKRIISGGGESEKPGEIKVWDLKTAGESLTLQGHTNQIGSVAFSPEGKRIVSGGYDATVRLWDAQTGKQVLTLQGHNDAVHSVLFSSDGKRLVSGSTDKTLKVWDAGTGKLQLTLRGHTHRVLSVAFSPDGKQIVSGSEDHTVRVWDAETGQESRELKGHSGLVREVAFSPDGKWIVSGAYDKTVRLWDAETGRMVRTLTRHAGAVYSVAFSPDSKRIVSGSADRTIEVWSLEPSPLAEGSKPPPQKGLVAHYPLNGDAQDASGNRHHGQPHGVVPRVDRHGLAKGAYYFPGGSRQYVSLPPFRYGPRFTISIWVQSHDQSKVQIIFTKKPRSAVDSFQIFSDSGIYNARVFSADNVGIGRSTLRVLYPAPKWVHLAVTYDGGNTPSAIRIYRDGGRIDRGDFFQEKGFTKFNDLMVASEIGSQNSGDQTFKGALDDLRIYKRALSGLEIKELYEVEKQPPRVSKPPTYTGLAKKLVEKNPWKIDFDGGSTYENVSFAADGSFSAFAAKEKANTGNGQIDGSWRRQSLEEVSVSLQSGARITITDESSRIYARYYVGQKKLNEGAVVEAK